MMKINGAANIPRIRQNKAAGLVQGPKSRDRIALQGIAGFHIQKLRLASPRA
jgi:hypothetical protein